MQKEKYTIHTWSKFDTMLHFIRRTEAFPVCLFWLPLDLNHIFPGMLVFVTCIYNIYCICMVKFVCDIFHAFLEDLEDPKKLSPLIIWLRHRDSNYWILGFGRRVKAAALTITGCCWGWWTVPAHCCWRPLNVSAAAAAGSVTAGTPPTLLSGIKEEISSAIDNPCPSAPTSASIFFWIANDRRLRCNASNKQLLIPSPSLSCIRDFHKYFLALIMNEMKRMKIIWKTQLLTHLLTQLLMDYFPPPSPVMQLSNRKVWFW